MWLFLITAAAAFGLLASMPPAPGMFISVICIGLFTAYTAHGLAARTYPARTAALQACVTGIFLIYLTLKKESAVFYLFLSRISGGFSACVGALTGRPTAMSVTYSGVDTVVLFLTVYAATALLYRDTAAPVGGRRQRTHLRVAGMVAIWGLYIALWTYLAESGIALGLNLLEPLTGPLDYRALLFVMLLVFYMYACGGRARAEAEAGAAEKRTAAVLLTLGVLTAAASALPSHAPVAREGARITFLDTGIDFSVPEHGRYGLDYVGMFGVLPHYLSRHGYQCATADSPDVRTLTETDVLVVINPMHYLDEAALTQLWDFVYAGGAVLAMGDHTGNEQVRLPLNAILEPVGITLNFDSAIPFKSLWAEEYVLHRSPALAQAGVRHVQTVVGASLGIGHKAKPIIIGTGGFSDIGDIENTADGYLGDMHFSRGERIGDLVLAAQASYGEGRFMVFGDTTAFQNTVIPYSYPMLDGIFAYLSENARGGSWAHDGFFSASCIIDASRLESLARDKSADSVDGLIASLMRAGIMPYVTGSPVNGQDEALATIRGDTALIILIEPAAAFSAAELGALTRFMETGGCVLLCAGYDSPEASKALAGHFGFSFDPMPIGRIAPDKNPEMAFWNACPVLYRGASPTAGTDAVVSVMEVWDYSTIAYKPVGDGGLYVFGDADFLKNKNLESVDAYREGNVQFLDALLRMLMKGQRVE